MSVTINRPKAIVDRLNPACLDALNGALGLAKSNTHSTVEIEHWLLKLMQPADGDLARIFRHFEVDVARVSRELTRAVEGFRRGSAGSLQLSQELLDWMREAWSLASLEYGAGRIRSGYLLAALLGDRGLRARAREASPEIGRIDEKKLQEYVPTLIRGSAEDAGSDEGPATGDAAQADPRLVSSKTPALDQFTVDITAQARAGKLDAVIGRDFEVRQVIDILLRRRQNNPILTGEAGVGKTAVVEGFAQRIAAGDVPPPLKNVVVRSLDLALLQAGAGVKGEFENRLKSVIAEVKASPIPIILFIDEAHTLIGAGGAAGQGDAANLLKPALARGELRTVAATTWMEYKKYFEGDPALKRRFQVVKVAEPDITLGVQMMRGVAPMLEKHHKVRILDEAVEEAVRLSLRYITDRQLPDKSVTLLDTSCARIALSQSATPAPLEDATREIEICEVEARALTREEAAGVEHEARLADLRERKTRAEARKAALEKQWAEEKRLVGEIQELRKKLEGATADKPLAPADLTKAQADLAAKTKELLALQGETPLVQPVVNGQAVAEVVSAWTGVPLGKMVRNEITSVLGLRDTLKERVVGQDYALESIAQRIQTARANLADPRRPLGVFMLVGPSGVGKTETALALAEILFGGDRNMVVINMSEYKEDHKISRLTGSAPGYVGYGEGGVLTEAVRRKPYSVVLLDEIEKANVAIQEIFYQVFDKGTLQDDRGIEVNFKNTVILLTSNVGTDTFMKVCADPDTCPEPEGLIEAIRPDLLKAFKPAFLGRLSIIPYYPLGDTVLKSITRLKLGQIVDRVKANHKALLAYDDALVDAVVARCKEVESGARNVDHILTGTLLPELAREFLGHMAEGRAITRVQVGVDTAGKFAYRVE